MITIQELQKLDKELRENRSKRILICFCVDSSASMARSGAIERVRVGLDRFFDKISKDTLAHDAANVCVILFSDEPELVCDYGPLESTMAQLCAHPIRAVGAQTMLAVAAGTSGMIHRSTAAPMSASPAMTMPTTRYAHLYIDMYLLIFSSFFAAICSYSR